MEHFLHEYLSVLLNGENDHYFSALKVLTGGATSPRMGKLLNFAASLMNDDECYVEVGVFTGFTLCAAGYLNNRKCIGIDNFDMSSVGWVVDPLLVQNRCEANINNLCVNGKLIKSD